MKVLIITSGKNPEESKKDSQYIIDILDKKGITYIATSTLKEQNNKPSNVFNDIKMSDAIIAMPSINEIDIGGFVNIAISHRKPILLLYEDKEPSSFLFEENNLICKLEINDKTKKSLDIEIKPFFISINKKRLLYRFNLMLNREMNLFISRKSRTYDISKADYLRQLILNDMNGSNLIVDTTEMIDEEDIEE